MRQYFDYLIIKRQARPTWNKKQGRTRAKGTSAAWIRPEIPTQSLAVWMVSCGKGKPMPALLNSS